MRTFVDVPDKHPEYGNINKLLNKCGFYKIPDTDHPITALYVAQLVGAPSFFDVEEVIKIYEFTRIVIGNFNNEQTQSPSEKIIKIDLKRQSII